MSVCVRVCVCGVCVCACVRVCVRTCVCVCVCVPEHVIASSLQISMSVVLASTIAPNTALTYMGPMAVRARLGTHWRMTGGTALVGASVGVVVPRQHESLKLWCVFYHVYM